MPKNNIEDFRLCAGLIFNQALAAFPRAVSLDDKAICETLLGQELRQSKPDLYGQVEYEDPEHIETLDFVVSTSRWLVDEGYLRSRSHYVDPGSVTLTQNGFYILGVEALDNSSEKLGRKLAQHVEAGAWDSVRDVTSNVLLAGIKLGWEGLKSGAGMNS